MAPKCFIAMNSIPANYIGNLTVGQTNVNTTQVIIRFQKPNKGGEMGIVVTTDGSGYAILPITTVENAFFSDRYSAIEITAVEYPSQARVAFLDPDDASEKDGLLLPFSADDCDWVTTDISLTKNPNDCNC